MWNEKEDGRGKKEENEKEHAQVVCRFKSCDVVPGAWSLPAGRKRGTRYVCLRCVPTSSTTLNFEFPAHSTCI